MKCPNCGFENRDDARFCKECGTKLSLSRDEEIYEKSKKSEQLYSSREPYREEYDRKETAYLEDEESYMPGHYEKKKGAGVLPAAAAVLVLCVCVAAGAWFFLFRGGQGEKTAENTAEKITAQDSAAANSAEVEKDASADTGATSTKDSSDTPAASTPASDTPATEAPATESQAADTRAAGSTVAIGSGTQEEENAQVLEDTGADSYDYADITSADDFHGVYLDSDYSIVYPKNFFKGANVIEGGYELYTADNQVTLTVTKKEVEGDSVKTLRKLHRQYENMLGTDKESNGVNISPGDDEMDGWNHTIVAGNEKDNPGRGIYMIAAADDNYVYTQVFEYTDVSGGREYCPQNYVIECLYRGCSFSFTSHPKIRSYNRYMEEGNDILN